MCTILHSRWIFPRDNEWIFSPTGPLLDLGSNSGQCLSGLEDPRTLAVLWNPGLSEGQPGPSPSGTQIYGVAHQAKLGEAMQGLVIPRSRILDPESGGSCVRDPRSGIQKGGGGVTLKTLGLRAPLRGERLDSGFWILPNMARICLFSVSQAPRSRIQPRHTACSVRAAALGIEIV